MLIDMKAFTHGSNNMAALKGPEEFLAQRLTMQWDSTKGKVVLAVRAKPSFQSLDFCEISMAPPPNITHTAAPTRCAQVAFEREQSGLESLMGMMEGNTELPAVMNPKLPSEQRTAAVGEDRTAVRALPEAEATAGRHTLTVGPPVAKTEHTIAALKPLDFTSAACCQTGCAPA